MIIEQKDFDFRMLRDIPCQKRRKGNPGRRNNSRKYKDIICAFDMKRLMIVKVNRLSCMCGSFRSVMI